MLSKYSLIMLFHQDLNEALKKRKVVKVIAGLSNFNLNTIFLIAKAAELGRATYLDIAANVNILYQVKQVCSLPICVSSIDIDELYSCFKAGADILEIGNFDIFYQKNIIINEQQLFNLARTLRYRAPSSCICVTIPHILNLSAQIKLAQRLESLGIDIIQTEGISSQTKNNIQPIYALNNASASLSSTSILAQYIKIPIISSSSINALSAPIAISYGASGVGVGSCISQLTNCIQMTWIIQSIVKSIDDNIILDIEKTDLLLSVLMDQCFSEI